MAGLYKKVLRGIYPKIPSHFSSDLNAVIKALLNVNPSARPGCDQILQMPVIRKMGQRIFKEDAFEEESQWTQAELLSTIRVPRNLLYLTDKLPKPSYESGSRRSYQKDSNSPPRARRTQEPGGSLNVNE